MRDTLRILNQVAQIIYDKKGVNLLALDLQNFSTLTDFVMIAEGYADRHVIGIGEAILKQLKDLGITPLHIEGLKEGDWVVLDFLNFMIHLFMPEWREKYRLEELWQEGKVLDLDIPK